MSLNISTSTQSHHVTAVITHRVKPGREQGYEEWIKGISAAAREFEGHLGVSILRPRSDSSPNYVIVLQFDHYDHLAAWFSSATRKEWIDRAAPLIREQESIQTLTGLESWFQLPKQPSSKTPKRYKQAILIWVAVMAVALSIGSLIDPVIERLPGLLGLAIDVAITVYFLSYIIMPRLTHWFKGWLFSH
ncbi:antibiotic biosynthesis monooxygenase [Leptolyngbya cf. ectocarpi LEGE 11479]|uniref:Antibiotic biosynthesis monooxygenase n=1 Tax=Leptolyngbya cf. ectocarpi LEGE 11479 TaxID=1828722 RepID=A0A928ZVD8_LEPEC|nr:antibiotic biosynthesis monooxygenase [Leptolyngbya ectocarpi]MBE9068173.1 antibiotic biosynthesis monooxygenase [Leptolyngbya cf. ectocarpi LEGE 11479]